MAEFEQKYIFTNSQAPILEALLRTCCREDSQYKCSKVMSIYLESLDGSSYSEKINSDYYKTKYRVRWYEDPSQSEVVSESPGIVPVFLEKKCKMGSQRKKYRESVQCSLDEMKNNDLASLYHQKWKFHFYESGTTCNLEPYIQISYIRKRFYDPLSNSRISLDFNIRVERSNPLYAPPPCTTELSSGVLEIKRDSPDSPEVLHHLTHNVTRKTSFSKYERCVTSMMY